MYTLTDCFSVIAFETEVAHVAITLPWVFTAAVLTVPVWNTLGAVGAGPSLAADTSVGHHAEPL